MDLYGLLRLLGSGVIGPSRYMVLESLLWNAPWIEIATYGGFVAGAVGAKAHKWIQGCLTHWRQLPGEVDTQRKQEGLLLAFE